MLALTAPLATVGVLAAVLGLAILAVPVRTPLQDCGTSFAFLIDGRTDVYGDPTDPPGGATKADVESNNAKACRARVADRAKPAAFLIPGGVLLAVVAAIAEVVIRLSRAPRRPRSTPPGPPNSPNGT